MINSMEHLIRQAVEATIWKQSLMGFGSAYRTALDVETGSNSAGGTYCWGVWNHHTESLDPNHSTAISGRLEGICLKEGKEYKGETRDKLAIYLDSGREQYVIKAGLGTAFSRGMIIRFLELPWISGRLIKISVRQGDDEAKAVLANLQVYDDRYQRFVQVKTDRPFPKPPEAMGLYKSLITAGYYEIGSKTAAASQQPAAAKTTTAPAQPRTPSAAPAAALPKAEGPPPHSKNYTRISEIKERTGHTNGQIKASILSLKLLPEAGLNSDKLTDPQMILLRDYLYADWAVGQRAFDDIGQSISTLEGLLKRKGRESDQVDWEVWEKEINEVTRD